MLGLMHVDRERKRKIDVFYNLVKDGKEFFYEPRSDVLYADLNLTLTDKHLGMALVKHLLSEEAYEEAEKIWKDKHMSKTSKVKEIAKLVKGKNILDLKKASIAAVEEIEVAEYIKNEIRNLGKTKLRIWTDTPKETAELFIKRKIEPLYNPSGDKTKTIKLYATILEQERDGTLTGNTCFIPSESFRFYNYQMNYLGFQKRVLSK